MIEYRKPQCEFFAADLVEEPPKPAMPETVEVSDHAAADFTERRCDRFLSADVAR